MRDLGENIVEHSNGHGNNGRTNLQRKQPNVKDLGVVEIATDEKPGSGDEEIVELAPVDGGAAIKVEQDMAVEQQTKFTRRTSARLTFLETQILYLEQLLI
ncbi:unnamed protein product [Gongylonema pulchrum]|uniref:Pentatricopeptide repeat-containing protein n=1 Tax=Gongylonema pulchrum TaxID=637853 RepID=A0A183EKF4_9BILA|nr:unnamed protein product [Gongylonema pulchrum]